MPDTRELLFAVNLPDACDVVQIIVCQHLVVEGGGFRQIPDEFLDLQRVFVDGEFLDADGAGRGSKKPVSIRRVVVLPAPLGPNSPRISPLRISKPM